MMNPQIECIFYGELKLMVLPRHDYFNSTDVM